MHDYVTILLSSAISCAVGLTKSPQHIWSSKPHQMMSDVWKGSQSNVNHLSKDDLFSFSKHYIQTDGNFIPLDTSEG